MKLIDKIRRKWAQYRGGEYYLDFLESKVLLLVKIAL